MTHPSPQVQPPGEVFNFAQHLIERNAGRPSKTAYIDDQGRLGYGELAERTRRLAAEPGGTGLSYLSPGLQSACRRQEDAVLCVSEL